jgi:hypothetical protein
MSFSADLEVGEHGDLVAADAERGQGLARAVDEIPTPGTSITAQSAPLSSSRPVSLASCLFLPSRGGLGRAAEGSPVERFVREGRMRIQWPHEEPRFAKTVPFGEVSPCIDRWRSVERERSGPCFVLGRLMSCRKMVLNGSPLPLRERVGRGVRRAAAACAADPSPSAPDGAPPSPARGEGMDRRPQLRQVARP